MRRAVAGIARYVAGKKPTGARVIVGRDPRYMGERFVEIAAEVLRGFGVQPLVIAEPAPTPAISYEVIRSRADGAINFTASHNPSEYSGIKFSTPDGAPALPEATSAIEALIATNGEVAAGAPAKVPAEAIDPKPAYLARLKEIVDLPLIRASGLKSCIRSALGRRPGLFRRTAARGRHSRRHGPRYPRRPLWRPCARAGRTSAQRDAPQDERYGRAHRHCHGR